MPRCFPFAVFLMLSSAAAAQNHSAQPPAIDDTIDAGEEEGEPPARTDWNEFDAGFSTFRFGGGWLHDYAAFAQDDASKSQVELSAQPKLRDFRVLFKGRLNVPGTVTWSAGIMYDKANDEWVFRQTGVMISVPKLWGDIFIGRTKEGFSLNKVMVGYAGWTMERAPINDATIPILADGVKWLGYVPGKKILWNVGVYGDELSQGQGFSTYHHQVSGRFAWLPLLSTDGGTLLHLGFSARHGWPKDETLRLRARPGAWPSPYFVDTGEFAANSTTMGGLEVYYRPGPLLVGSELFVQRVDAEDSGNPIFHGGEVEVSWMLTGETRSYNTRGGYFNAISPGRPVFNGGFGAWEFVAHATWVDLDDGNLTGGTFWRMTPMVNWHATDNIRLELAYGYGSLSRFGVTGKTQFFQSRIQLTL